MREPGKVVVVSGPSGAGKSTILSEALKRTGACFGVSVTTRRKRPGEQDGRHYRFIERRTFEEMIRWNELLEWAEVFGELYGTPGASVRQAVAAGKTIVLDIDVQGALQVRREMPDAAFVAVMPPSLEELAGRLRRRQSETEEQLAQRMSRAKQEVQAIKDAGVYNHWIINDDLDTAVGELVTVISQENPKR